MQTPTLLGTIGKAERKGEGAQAKSAIVATPPKPYLPATRGQYLKRNSALETERATWIQHWREIGEQMLPRRTRFFYTERNKGLKRNEKIINSTPLRALRTLSSGMHSGLTSPARPWFRLTMPDPDLAEFDPVKQWLHLTETNMRTVFARSNLYNALPQLYGDVGGFGTGALWVDDDLEDVIRCYVLPCGSYSLAGSARQQVNTIYHRLSMTVGGLVQAFGFENCTTATQEMYRNNNVDAWRIVIHAVEPNLHRDQTKRDSKSMPFRSVWFEADASDGREDKFLAEGGYQDFPAMCPRWNTTGEDVYGYSPGMDALGDARALQVLERRKAQLIDLIVRPPMKGPSSLRNQRATLLPGDVTYVDATAGGTTFEPAMVVPAQALPAIEQSIREHEQRIDEAFFADLWLMIAGDERATPATAEEIRARNDEKLLQLGPVLERLHDELLDPLIDRTFTIMLNRGLIPPPPKELQEMAARGENSELKVEYISVLAQAQKLVGTGAVERLYAFSANVASTHAEALDLVDTDVMVREYATMLGVNPKIVRGEEEVQALRDAKAQAAQQQAQMAAMQQAADAAQKGGAAASSLGSVDMSTDNGLTRLLGALGPAAVAGAGQPSGGVGLPEE